MLGIRILSLDHGSDAQTMSKKKKKYDDTDCDDFFKKSLRPWETYNMIYFWLV